VITAPTELLEGDRLRVPEFPHRLIFVRHGETNYNAESRLQGQLDIPLNARGRDQARSVGRILNDRLGIEIERLETAGAFFASPLERARETMEIARDAMGLKPGRYHLDAVLKELNFGVWEGLTWPEVEVKDPKGLRDRRKDRWGFAPKDGESYAMLADRLRPWLDTVNEHAFVISHGGVARVLMVLIAGVPPAKAVDTPILQGKAIVFENGGLRWIG
jgi:broad specificity phosphatase PhoE